MFFSLSPHKDERFVEHEQLGRWWFSHDSGWHKNAGCWYKGYDHPGLEHGNFVKLTSIGKTLSIEHDRYRSFPLWYDPDTSIVTNLLGTGRQIWADQKISMDQDGSVSIQQIDPIGDLMEIELSLDQAADKICENLTAKAQALADSLSDWPRKLFLTGGIDTLTLYSVLRYANVDIDIVDYEYIKYDRFLNNNLAEIKEHHWGYRQIHHWTSPTLLITGGCGDEFMFRGPTTIALWSAWTGINLRELLSNSHGYHVGYYLKSKNLKVFDDAWHRRDQILETYPTRGALHRQILDMNINDHQHWHLGATLTWTPFKDLALTKLCLCMDQDSIIAQVLDAALNKRIVQKLDPSLLGLLSSTKNSNNRANLNGLLDQSMIS